MGMTANKVWSSVNDNLDTHELATIARSMIAARKALHGPLPMGLLHDPSLDLLLNLFVAHAGGRTVERAALIACTTTNAPTTERWLRALSQEGFVDDRGATCGLSDVGIDAVATTLRAVARSQWQFATAVD